MNEYIQSIMVGLCVVFVCFVVRKMIERKYDKQDPDEHLMKLIPENYQELNDYYAYEVFFFFIGFGVSLGVIKFNLLNLLITKEQIEP